MKKEWFKARNIWGAALDSIADDAAAGKLMKALWHYTMDGVVDDLPPELQGYFVMMTLTLKQDEEEIKNISKARSEAGSKGGYQKVANQANVANASFATESKQDVANVANADNKNKSKKENKREIKETESLSSSFIDDEAAAGIVAEQNRMFEAAENAGFPRTETVRAKLLSLFSMYGLEKMLYGINACVEYGAVNLAYLAAVLKGEPRKQKQTGKTVYAQQYTQRDYSNADEEAMNRFMESVKNDLEHGILESG